MKKIHPWSVNQILFLILTLPTLAYFLLNIVGETPNGASQLPAFRVPAPWIPSSSEDNQSYSTVDFTITNLLKPPMLSPPSELIVNDFASHLAEENMCVSFHMCVCFNIETISTKLLSNHIISWETFIYSLGSFYCCFLMTANCMFPTISLFLQMWISKYLLDITWTHKFSFLKLYFIDLLLQLSWFFPLCHPPPSTPHSLKQSPYHCSCP